MGIVLAAIITAVAVLAAYGILISRLSRPEGRTPLLIAFAVALPLQPLAFYFVRVPLDRLLVSAIGTDGLYPFMTTLYAPLTEEPAKWLVLLIPAVRRALVPSNAAALALATGLGFGIGEIGFLAEQIARVPAYADIPFWAFGGFLFERFVVCFLHGGFLLFLFRAIAQARNPAPGAAAGMGLHYLLNFPIFLMSLGALGLTAVQWQSASTLVLVGLAGFFGWVVSTMAPARR